MSSGWHEPDDAELDALLRRSLSAQADRIEPAGDGLRLIRERTAPDRLWSRLRVPALVLAGVAAVVAALVAAPSVLPSLTPSPRTAAQPSGSAASGPTPIPGAGVNDVLTVWPYPNRAEGFRQAGADQTAGTYGDLTRPDQVAIRFIGSYVGARSLSVVSAGAYQAGLRMEVRWRGRPVSLVYVVRVRVGDDAPYVVVDAVAPDGNLAVDRTATVPSSGLLTVRGTVAAGAAPRVQLRTPGRTLVLSATAATVHGDRWSAALSLPDGTRAAAMTAWTVDPGGVTAFVSRPLG
jgi:hypothetical protein